MSDAIIESYLQIVENDNNQAGATLAGYFRYASYAICLITTYDQAKRRPRTQKGLSRAVDSVAGRKPRPPRIRNRETDRNPFKGCAVFPSGLFVPAAVPAGSPRLDTRPVGREGEAAPTPLLSPDPRGTKGARRATSALAAIRRSHSPHHGNRLCVIGRKRFADGWPQRNSIRFRKQR